MTSTCLLLLLRKSDQAATADERTSSSTTISPDYRSIQMSKSPECRLICSLVNVRLLSQSAIPSVCEVFSVVSLPESMLLIHLGLSFDSSRSFDLEIGPLRPQPVWRCNGAQSAFRSRQEESLLPTSQKCLLFLVITTTPRHYMRLWPISKAPCRLRPRRMSDTHKRCLLWDCHFSALITSLSCNNELSAQASVLIL